MEADTGARAAVSMAMAIIATVAGITFMPVAVTSVAVAAMPVAVASVAGITAPVLLNPLMDWAAAVVAADKSIGPVNRLTAAVISDAGARAAAVMAGVGGGGGEGGEADKSGAEEAEQFHGSSRALVGGLMGGTAVAAAPLLVDSAFSDGRTGPIFMRGAKILTLSRRTIRARQYCWLSVIQAAAPARSRAVPASHFFCSRSHL